MPRRRQEVALPASEPPPETSHRFSETEATEHANMARVIAAHAEPHSDTASRSESEGGADLLAERKALASEAETEMKQIQRRLQETKGNIPQQELALMRAVISDFNARLSEEISNAAIQMEEMAELGISDPTQRSAESGSAALAFAKRYVEAASREAEKYAARFKDAALARFEENFGTVLRTLSRYRQHVERTDGQGIDLHYPDASKNSHAKHELGAIIHILETELGRLHSLPGPEDVERHTLFEETSRQLREAERLLQRFNAPPQKNARRMRRSVAPPPEDEEMTRFHQTNPNTTTVRSPSEEETTHFWARKTPEKEEEAEEVSDENFEGFVTPHDQKFEELVQESRLQGALDRLEPRIGTPKHEREPLPSPIEIRRPETIGVDNEAELEEEASKNGEKDYLAELYGNEYNVPSEEHDAPSKKREETFRPEYRLTPSEDSLQTALRYLEHIQGYTDYILNELEDAERLSYLSRNRFNSSLERLNDFHDRFSERQRELQGRAYLDFNEMREREINTEILHRIEDARDAIQKTPIVVETESDRLAHESDEAKKKQQQLQECADELEEIVREAGFKNSRRYLDLDRPEGVKHAWKKVRRYLGGASQDPFDEKRLSAIRERIRTIERDYLKETGKTPQKKDKLLNLSDSADVHAIWDAINHGMWNATKESRKLDEEFNRAWNTPPAPKSPGVDPVKLATEAGLENAEELYERLWKKSDVEIYPSIPRYLTLLGELTTATQTTQTRPQLERLETIIGDFERLDAQFRHSHVEIPEGETALNRARNKARRLRERFQR